jgi:hypothetical protein
MIFTITDTTLRIKIIMTSAGVPNASSVQTYETWDFISPDARSKQTAVRHGCKIHFIKRPMFVAGKMESAIKEK